MKGKTTHMGDLAERPIIGITTYSRDEDGDFCLPGAYVDSVRKAGGVPILLPPGETDLEALFSFLDGLIFTGGGDIHPDLYGGEWHPTLYMVDTERDTFEVELARRALHSPLPVLGICRGLEVLSVATEGKLVPHVPDQFGEEVAHRTVETAEGNAPQYRKPTPHRVRIEPGSRLARIIGASDIPVMSWHHQATLTAPAGWRVVAWAPDGVIEAMEHQQHPWLIAVQWHPELSPDDPYQKRLFRALVEAARGYKERRRRKQQ